MPVPSENNFAAILEERASEPQDFVCFLDSVTGETCTYFDMRLRGVWLARELEAQGVVRGGMCAVDMPNCASLLYTVVAAAYGGFTLVLLNPQLTSREKKQRVAELKRSQGLKRLPILTEDTAATLAGAVDEAGRNARGLLTQWARHGVGAFDEFATALVCPTAGTHGKPKLVPITWAALLGATRASNAVLNKENEGIWQLSLPAFHIDGLSIFFRSVLNHNALILYRAFDAHKILADAKTYSATHIAVVDKHLQDLLSLDANPGEEAEMLARLSAYECILLGGTQPNRATLIRALGAGAPIYASYGMTETTSQVATAHITDSEQVMLEPLPGYELAILSPDETGFGQLAVKGPGVLASYLNAQAAFTVDNYFLTGDRAREVEGRFEIAESESAKFASGGENIYPEEIRNKILAFEGVTEAYVFGAKDEEWGRRPVAFVEAREGAARPGFNAYYFADDMRNRLSTRLSSLYMPDQFVVMKEFPRSGIGKVSTGTLNRMWDARLQVAKVEIWQLRLPLVEPIRVAKTRMRSRDTLIVRLTDWAGRTGLGECASFASDWYGPETLAQDLPLIHDALAPLLVGRVLLRPSDTAELFENVPGAADAPFACAALENALWDLYGKIRGRSIRALIGGREAVAETGSLLEIPAGCVPGGVVISLGTPAEVLAAATEAVDAGYKRVKIKIKPGNDIDVVRAVRNAYPDLTIMVDADQSYHDDMLELFQQLDELGVECIEEPLDPAFAPTVGPTDLFDRLSRLQARLRMRVCLDESWETGEQLYEILEAHPELRCVSLKIGKFGGVAAALDFHKWARERGIEAWPGGMYETGVSKRLHAAFGLLPGVNLAGDISDSARYFTVDICNPPFVLHGGFLLVNENGHEAGLGCELNEDILANVAENYWIIA